MAKDSIVVDTTAQNPNSIQLKFRDLYGNRNRGVAWTPGALNAKYGIDGLSTRTPKCAFSSSLSES